MAAIVAPNLAQQMASRIRPRAEWFIGLQTLLISDLPYLTDVTPGTTVDDGSNPEIPFTGELFAGYVSLVQALIAAATTDVTAAYQSAVVRDLQTILSGFPPVGSTASTDPAAIVLAQRIRPRALAIRKLNYWFGNDLVATAPNLTAIAAAQPTDTIAENREVPDVTVGALNAMLAFEAACTGPSFNTSTVSLVIEAACGQPLALN